MDDEQFTAYRQRSEGGICAFTDEVEKEGGHEFDCFILRHAFTEAVSGAQIVKRRHFSGKAEAARQAELQRGRSR